MSLLTVDKLSFAFGLTPILQNISFSLNAGEVLSILGPNGSGKTTLIRLLLGTMRYSGSIQWNQRELRKWKRPELAKLMAYLPQAPSYEPDQQVVDFLRLGRFPYLGHFGIESEKDVLIVEQVARDLSLSELLTRPMEDLSGGQRQRVFIGRCLVQQPQVLLLDEPATFLDLKHQVDLHQLLTKLAKEQNIAVLMSCHDLNLASAHADRAMVLRDGSVLACGKVQDVLREDILTKAYDLPMRRVEIDGRVMIVPVG